MSATLALPARGRRATIVVGNGAYVKGWIGWILLALSLLVAVGGYRNQRPEQETEDMSKLAACDVGEPCTIDAKRPFKIRTDVMSRRYEWATSVGPVTVACKRRFLLAGNWQCVPTRGPMGE
jgi:hypothetical protein